MCERIALHGGGFAIICGGHHRRRHPCRSCGRPSTKLCDHKNSDGRTCDAPICDNCGLHIEGKNRDYCALHAKQHLHERPPRALPFEEPA